MKAAVALLCSAALLFGCFPNDPHKRTIAKYVEGGSLVVGIAISAFANTGADCDQMAMQGPHVDSSCRTVATVLGTTGLLFILGGLLGFVATIATAEDAVLANDMKEAEAHPLPKGSVKLPPGVGTGSASGSASGSGAGSAAPAPAPAPPADAGSGAPPT